MEMSRLLGLQNGIIYGPIDSRRLGSSLGINLLPVEYKACPFNCAYCQYGYTPARGYKSVWGGDDMPPVAEVAEALRVGLGKYPDVSYITFSGNGEPTLHPQFGEIVDEVRKIKEELTGAEIREALGKLDVCFMKLDAGDETMFRRYNRPHKDIKYDEVIEGLKQLGEITIQALFAGGEHGNYNDLHIKNWARKIDGKLTQIDKNGLIRLTEIAAGYTDVPIKVF